MPPTKGKHRLNGRGDRAIDRFLRDIAALAPVVPVEGRLSDLDKWRKGVARLEKQAAVVLCNPPVVYSVRLQGSRAGNSPKTSLRLSVGLSLSIGVPHFRRYVVTLARGARRVTLEQGTLLAIPRGAKATLLTTLPGWAEQSMPLVVRGVIEACEQFQARPDVQDAVQQIGERRRTEFAGLEHLYARRQKSEGRLHGLPETGTEGSASIDAEQRMLQRVVLERYSVRVRVRVLSLGLLSS